MFRAAPVAILVSLLFAAPAGASPFLERHTAQRALHVGFDDYAHMTDGRVVVGRCTHRWHGYVWRATVQCRVQLRGGSSPATYRGLVRLRAGAYFVSVRQLR